MRDRVKLDRDEVFYPEPGTTVELLGIEGEIVRVNGEIRIANVRFASSTPAISRDSFQRIADIVHSDWVWRKREENL
jgi:hypothetical protein